MKNYDKIRSWESGELADFLERIVDCDLCPAKKTCHELRRGNSFCNCSKTIMTWLEEEAK